MPVDGGCAGCRESPAARHYAERGRRPVDAIFPFADEVRMQGAFRLTRQAKYLSIIICSFCLLLLSGCLRELFATGAMPRRLLYRPALLWTNVAESAVTFLAYASILCCLLWLANRLRCYRAMRPYTWFFVCVATFLTFCGIAQLMSIVTFWWALFSLATLIKSVYAASAAVSAMILLRVTPRLAVNIAASLDMLSVEQREKGQVQLKLQESQKSWTSRWLRAMGSASGNGTFLRGCFVRMNLWRAFTASNRNWRGPAFGGRVHALDRE